MDPETNAIRNDELQYAMDEREPLPDPDVEQVAEVRARGNGKLSEYKQRIMNRVQRRREGVTAHAVPRPTTGQPPHRIAWSTATDQRLVLDAIRCGLVRTGEQRNPWGKGGFFPTRKALYVAVEKARQAGWEQTPQAQEMARQVEARWSQ